MKKLIHLNTSSTTSYKVGGIDATGPEVDASIVYDKNVTDAEGKPIAQSNSFEKGEIAVCTNKGHEALIIKNISGDTVEFAPLNVRTIKMQYFDSSKSKDNLANLLCNTKGDTITIYKYDDGESGGVTNATLIAFPQKEDNVPYSRIRGINISSGITVYNDGCKNGETSGNVERVGWMPLLTDVKAEKFTNTITLKQQDTLINHASLDGYNIITDDIAKWSGVTNKLKNYLTTSSASDTYITKSDADTKIKDLNTSFEDFKKSTNANIEYITDSLTIYIDYDTNHDEGEMYPNVIIGDVKYDMFTCNGEVYKVYEPMQQIYGVPLYSYILDISDDKHPDWDIVDKKWLDKIKNEMQQSPGSLVYPNTTVPTGSYGGFAKLYSHMKKRSVAGTLLYPEDCYILIKTMRKDYGELSLQEQDIIKSNVRDCVLPYTTFNENMGVLLSKMAIDYLIATQDYRQ